MQERIYCSEQIKIPAEYPEIMKAYSKAVLAEQPQDLIDFSIKYFGKLASEKTAKPQQPYAPNVRQIAELFKRIKSLASNQIAGTLKEGGIPDEVVKQLENWVAFAGQQLELKVPETNQAKLYIILLFCITQNSMYEVLSSVFYVLSTGKMGYIPADDTLFLFGVLAKLDYRIEKTAMDIIKEMVGSGQDVLFDDVVARLGITKK